MSLKEEINTYQKLLWLLTAGVTETIGETPINRFGLVTKQASKSEWLPTMGRETPSVSRGAPSSPQGTPSHSSFRQPFAGNKDGSRFSPVSNGQSHILTEQATTLAQSATTLEALYRQRDLFQECPLKKTAAHTLNGWGCPTPTVLCLTDTPDRSDDKTGKLFSQDAGQLLVRMLAAIGLDLTHNTYVSALIPWRPPGNRAPTDTEQALCKPFWEKEIALLKPRFILALGGNAAAPLIGIRSLSKARSSVYEYAGIPVCTIISPAVLLKMPDQRRQTWEDLKKFKAFIESTQSQTEPMTQPEENP